MNDTPDNLTNALRKLDPSAASYASDFLELLFNSAQEARASDVHLQPMGSCLEICWRIDGVLHPIGEFSPGTNSNVVSRLKVLADLLTYRNDLPQEGRIRAANISTEMRVSTLPTLHGERAVVRMFAREAAELLVVEDLGFPRPIAETLRRTLGETTGALLVTGPAGSGKTTTVYACLRELTAHPTQRRSIVTVEDPIENALPTVVQSQVNASAGYDLAVGLRAAMRQDPEVIMVGEIRDRATAEAAFQAALTGHLLLTTFHAGSAAGALSRLADMGVEPYVLRSGVRAVVAQRLLRRLCSCARLGNASERLGLEIDAARVPVGCVECRGAGYRGRLVVAEMLLPQGGELAQAVLARCDAQTLHSRAVAAGMVPLWDSACAAVVAGETSPAELRRVFGFQESNVGR